MQKSVNRCRRLAAKVLVLAAVVASAGVIATPAESQTNPYQKGPNPTVQNIEALRGSFNVADTNVSSWVSGFGGGTIYYPTDTSQGTFGAVAIAPGFTASESSMAWLGPRLASRGFVIFTIDTNSRFDFPSSRASQLEAALEYLVEDSPVQNRIDENRLGVMGHSMGGGGTLIAARNNPEYKAAIPLAPWNTSSNFSSNQVPTLVVACENDSVASVSSHASPMYNSMSSSLDKGFLEINNGSHFCPNSSNTMIARYSIAWLKRFIDDDTRYDPFLCGAPHQQAVNSFDISEYRETCPY